MLPRLSIPLAALALAGCFGGDETTDTRTDSGPKIARETRMQVVEGELSSHPVFLSGNRIWGVEGTGKPQRLGAAAHAPLTGPLTPLAVTEPGGNRLVYNSWRRRTPELRLRNLATGEEEVVDRPAFAPAWRADGPLAYTSGGRVGRRHVFVRTAAGSSGKNAPETVQWTAEAGRYTVVAWAGKSLLVYRLRRRGPPDVLVFEGAGQPRVLATQAYVIALSPDGGRAFLAHAGSRTVVRVVAVRSGAETASLTLPRLTNPFTKQEIVFVGPLGSWSGDLVVAPAPPSLALFRVGETSIQLEQMLHLDPLEFPNGVYEPQTDASGRHIVVWGQLLGQSEPTSPATILECDRFLRRCLKGIETRYYQDGPPRMAFNPSRP